MPSSADAYFRLVKRTDPGYVVQTTMGRLIRQKAAAYLGGRLLDIGCGEKQKKLLVGDLVNEYVGVDHPGTYHDKSKVDLFATAYDIPVDSESFDSVLCTAVLEHLEEPQQALIEANRVLKAGGYAIYTMPLFWHLHEEPRDFYRYTRHGLKHLFEKAGFEIVEIVPGAGFITTFGVELNYYLLRFRRSVLRYLVDGFIGFNNWLIPRLDRGILRDERFTWMYLVVARKQPASSKSKI